MYAQKEHCSDAESVIDSDSVKHFSCEKGVARAFAVYRRHIACADISDAWRVSSCQHDEQSMSCRAQHVRALAGDLTGATLPFVRTLEYMNSIHNSRKT